MRVARMTLNSRMAGKVTLSIELQKERMINLTQTIPDAVARSVAEGNDVAPSMGKFVWWRHRPRRNPAFWLELSRVRSPNVRIELHG